MRHSIFQAIAGTAAVLFLPVASWAETPATPGNLPAGSLPSGGQTGGSSMQQPSMPGPAAGGIMVHDGAAYIVHRLQSEMSLPDGSKVQPNGVIEGKDGSRRQVGDDKMLTLDGRLLDAPFVQSSSGASQSSTGAMPPASGAAREPGISQPRTDGSTEPLGESYDGAPGATGGSQPGVGAGASTSTSTGSAATPVQPYPIPSTTGKEPDKTPGAPAPSEPFTPNTAPPASSTPFTPGSSPSISTEQPGALNSTSPGSGLQDTDPLGKEPSRDLGTDSATTDPFGATTQPGSISTDPTRDRIE